MPLFQAENIYMDEEDEAEDGDLEWISNDVDRNLEHKKCVQKVRKRFRLMQDVHGTRPAQSTSMSHKVRNSE